MSEENQAVRHSFEEEHADFDPLAGLSFDAEVDDEIVTSTFEDGPFGMPNPDAVPQFQGKLNSFADKETAAERIEALFEQMPTLQKLLYGILGECDTPIESQLLQDAVEELKKNHHCVYTPLTLCGLLEQAGAIVKVDENGALLSGITQEPLVVELEGERYWEVAPAPRVHWLLTDEGRAQYESYQPLERIRACYDEEPQYADIFTMVLSTCAQPGGASVKQVGEVVDDDPAVQKPRRYAMYFIDKLEHAGALDWGGSWVTTEYGNAFLEGQVASQK